MTIKKERAVSEKEFGEDWPFIVPSGTLACVWTPGGREAEVIFISPDGKKYGLAARKKEYSHIYPILKRAKNSYDNVGNRKVLVVAGVGLCPNEYFR
jgi:hypothetical protein